MLKYNKGNDLYYECKMMQDIPCTIQFSDHAVKRLREREINEYVVYSDILQCEDDILDLRNKEEFVIINKEARYASVCCIRTNGRIYIDIITVINGNNIYTRKGTAKIMKLDKGEV